MGPGPIHSSCTNGGFYGSSPLFSYLKLMPTSLFVDIYNVQVLSQVEVMLTSAAMTINNVYLYLPHGQYSYSGHVVNLSQDVISFSSSLP